VQQEAEQVGTGGGHLAAEARHRSRASGRGWAPGSRSSNPRAAKVEQTGAGAEEPETGGQGGRTHGLLPLASPVRPDPFHPSPPSGLCEVPWHERHLMLL
jgi:hypothetical protein